MFNESVKLPTVCGHEGLAWLDEIDSSDLEVWCGECDDYSTVAPYEAPERETIEA